MRPRVEDEVRRNLFFFESVLFDAVPAVLAELERCARRPRSSEPVLDLRLAGPAATWTATREVGADTLSRTLQLHRQTALRLLRDRVDRLARRFSHSVAAHARRRRS